MIENLFNLIIILVIVITVLKRLREVEKKGKELGGPPPVAPPLPWEPAAPPQTAPQPVLERPVPQTEAAETFEEERPEPVFTFEDMFEEEKTPAEPESVFKEEIVYPPEELIPVIPLVERQPQIVKIPTLNLSFSRSEVVRGIVMSEILRPPLALR
jgi:hypothetical protein